MVPSYPSLAFVDAPSCYEFQSVCASCQLLPFVVGVLITSDCNQPFGVIQGGIVQDLINLDGFLNRAQKTKREPVLFPLDGDMSSNSSLLEPLGRRMLHTWNVLLVREAEDCSDTIGAARTVFTLGPKENWCVDAVGRLPNLAVKFAAHNSPRARVRALAITNIEEKSAPLTFRATGIILASVSVWAISALIVFNRW